LKRIVDVYFPDPYSVWLNHLFIDSTESPGLPLGNQVAQVYALLMLHSIDHMITEKLGIKHYGRYMDDFFLIHHDKCYLQECLNAITNEVCKLGLKLNEKTQIIPFRKGIRFTGFHHYVTADGKYIRKITGENKRKMKKKLRIMAKQVRNGKLSEKKFYQCYEAWKNYALHGNCIKLCRSMDEFVCDLMNKEN
jgi:hypothetical protein